MAAEFIFIAPRFDKATEYSFAWCQAVEKYAIDKGYDVIILNKEQATRTRVEEELRGWPDACLIHYDHGDVDRIYGDGEPVIDLDNNVLLTKRECFSMSCLSAKTLGVDSYHRYHTTFWGSWEVISFTTDALDEFQRAMNFGIKLRLDGVTDWNIIMEKTLENDNDIIDELIGKGKIFAAALLRQDRDARRVWTDKTPPPDQNSKCFWRNLLLTLFGNRAWRISKPF